MKILTIDGGGVRGCIAAQMLVEVERLLGCHLGEYFDLIAGTSSGAIVASAIACGYSAEDVVNLYRDKSRIIFPYQSYFVPERLPLIAKFGFSAPKYSASGLELVVKEAFSTRKLGDIETPKLMITSYDTLKREPVIFKSWHKDKVKDLQLWEACACSAAAPTYFPGRQLNFNGELISAIDGGVCLNCCSISAVAEAIRLGYDLKDVSLLSVGTGDPTRPITTEEAEEWGVMEWSFRLVDLLFESPGGATDYISQQFLGDRYLRLQFKLNQQISGNFLNDDLDDSSSENLKNLIEAAQIYISTPETHHKLQNFLFEVAARR